MNLEYFEESLEALMYCGQNINFEQRRFIKYSLTILKVENRFTGMYYWGRVDGVLKDYYIAFGFTQDIIKDRKFFYSLNGFQWLMLPFISNPKIFHATISCREPFIGDPRLVTTIKLDFDVNGCILQNSSERYRLKELDRLAAIVFIITEESALCPRGCLYKLTNGCIVKNEMFRGIKLCQARNSLSYQLFRLPRYDPTTKLMCCYDYNATTDFLDFMADLILQGHLFATNFQHQERIIQIKSCTWPGMVFFHKLNSQKHGFCYFGNGKKNHDVIFML